MDVPESQTRGPEGTGRAEDGVILKGWTH